MSETELFLMYCKRSIPKVGGYGVDNVSTSEVHDSLFLNAEFFQMFRVFFGVVLELEH